MSKSLLERIETKIDKLDDRLDAIDIRLAKYNKELEFHVARTTQLEDELSPIVKHVEQVRGASKFVGWVVALVAAIGTLSWLWGK